MKDCILGLDVGTTAIKGVLIDENWQVLAMHSREHRQFFPQPGWVEQDPQELLASCCLIAESLLKETDCPAVRLRAIGLDHQGESCLIWEKKTGKPVYPVITWQDRRMAQASDAYGALHGREVHHLTGLRPDSYYSAWKLRWILDHIPDGQHRAENGELLAGTLNTWLIWKLTGGTSFVTDDGSAGCTMLADPRQSGWNEWLLSQMRIPACMLPECMPADAVLGTTSPDCFLGVRVPVTGSLTDCAAGIIGSGAARRGCFVTTYGTGNFMHLSTGTDYVTPTGGLTSTCCFSTAAKRLYQLNGISYTAGSAIQWLKDGLGLISGGKETEAMARSVPDTGGVYFVPALNGLATPFWDQSARGAFMGLSAAATKAHLVRAVLESSALQVANCCEIMRQASGVEVKSMIAIGGMTANGFLMQLQADLLGIPVHLPTQTEPAFGMACFAAAALGIGPGTEALPAINRPLRSYEPQLAERERLRRINSWQAVVRRCTDWKPETT